MKGKKPKLFGVAMALVLAVSLALAAVPVVPASADPGTLLWTDVPIPECGAAGDYTLWSGSDVGPIAVSPDGGTIFAAGESTASDAVNMSANLSAAATTVIVDSTTGFPCSGVLLIGTELISYTATNATANTFTGCTRGFAGTTAAIHDDDDPVTVGSMVMRSTDGGYGWKLMWAFPNPIVDIDVSDGWADDDRVVVATTAAVYRSSNRGQTFITWGTSAADFNGETITSLDVALDENGYMAAVVGTSGPGDVYLESEDYNWQPQTVSANLTTGVWDVLDVAIPTYDTRPAIIAVVSNTTLDETWAVTRWVQEPPVAWAANIADTGFVNETAARFASTRASLGFPENYSVVYASGLNVFFVGLTGENAEGDVFKVTSMPFGIPNVVASDLQIRDTAAVTKTETDIWSIAVSGNLTAATIIAGTADYNLAPLPGQSLVYYSTDDGATWSGTLKSPTGGPTGANAYVVMGSPIAYAGTSGTESAFSATITNGMGWNQRGLIDTVITAINDIAVSEAYATDKQLVMATQKSAAGTFSLWLTINDGITWDRVLCNSPSAALAFNMVQVVPGFIFVANSPFGVMLMSTDASGTLFVPAAVAPAAITAWNVISATTMYTGDASGNVHWTTDLGGHWYIPEESEIIGEVTDIELGSDILVGDIDGKVYLSTDEGLTFERVGTNAVGSNTTHVAFDLDYETNNIIYAGASAATDVYRFDVGTSIVWERISHVAASLTIAVSGLVSADDGTLYASDATAYVAATENTTGVWRSVDPTYAIALGGPTFEAMVPVPDDATLEGLEVVPGSNILFAIDTYNVGVVTFTDTLSGRVSPDRPTDGTSTGTIYEGETMAEVILAWDQMIGATLYEFQVALDEDFGTLVSATTMGLTTLDTALDTAGTVISVTLWPNETYYWRVRVSTPLLSQWSETWSFITVLGPGPSRPTLVRPSPDELASLTPRFEWTRVEGATGYEFQVATDYEMDADGYLVNVVSGLDKTGATALGAATAFPCPVTLTYDTTYVWQVRAIGAATESAWSDTGCFSTLEEPTPAVAAPTPVWVWVVIGIGAVLLIGVIVLIMRTRRPV